MNPSGNNKYQAAIAAQKAKQAQPKLQDPIPPKSPITIISTDYTDGAKDRLRSHSIEDAYQRFFAPKDMRGNSDNLLTNCFNTSAHSNGDANPSMDINVKSNVYVCHGCDITGDMVDLAANAARIVPAGERCPDNLVHEAVKYGCETLFPDMRGKFVNKGGNWQFQPITFDPAQFAAATPVITEKPNEYIQDIAWRDWVPQGSPLRAYMDIVTADDNPEEFHLFNFVQLIGLILGREVCMGGDYPFVHANLLLCHIGRTGQGKSKTFAYIRSLMANTNSLHFDENDHTTQGIRIVSGVGSGEILVDSLGHSVPDLTITPGQTQPSNRKLFNTSPRSLVIWSEFSNLVAKAQQSGSTMNDKVIDMYDLVDPMSAITRAHRSKAHHPYGSGVTTTQLDIAQELFSRTQVESGFLNRWIFVIGGKKDYIPFNSHIDVSPVSAHINSLYNWMNGIVKTQRGVLNRDDAADDEAAKFLRDTIQPLKESEDAGPMFARMDLLFKKLILIASANMMEKTISINAVYQAEKMWYFLKNCMLTVAEKMTLGNYNELEDYIVKRVEASSQAPDKRGFYGIQPTELRKSVIKKFKITPKEVEATLRQMKDDKVIILMDTRTAEQKAKAGRPAERYLPYSEH